MYVTLHMYATPNRPEVFFIMQDTDDLEALKYQNLTGDESTKCRRFENKLDCPASSDDGQVQEPSADVRRRLRHRGSDRRVGRTLLEGRHHWNANRWAWKDGK